MTNQATNQKIFKDLEEYLQKIGVNFLETKSEYEIARFKVNNKICVIYSGKKGFSGSNSMANNIINSFLNKKLINIQEVKRKPNLKDKFYQKLLERDGNFCFYTGTEMTRELASIEHLIPLSKGGKNNLDNLVLCLKEENIKMSNLPLVEKIKYKISNLKAYRKL